MRSCWGCSYRIRTSTCVDLDCRRRPGTAKSRATCRVSRVACHPHRFLLVGNFRLTSPLLAARPYRLHQQQRSQITCSSQHSKSSNSKRPRRGWPPWNWPEHLPSVPRLVFNLTALFLLMRIWPLSGRSPLGQPQAVSVPVPFSEFIQQAQSAQVVSVIVDNRNIKYVLRPDARVFENIPQTEEPVRVAFQTTRPADYAMPYDMLMAQDVQFSAVDSRNNSFLTVMVSLLLTLLQVLCCCQMVHVHDHAINVILTVKSHFYTPLCPLLFDNLSCLVTAFVAQSLIRGLYLFGSQLSVQTCSNLSVQSSV